MNTVSAKLVNYYPDSWESANYDGTLYVLKPVYKNSLEFMSVANNFPRTIDNLYRIQNPLAYLRYILHGEHLIHLPSTTQWDYTEVNLYNASHLNAIACVHVFSETPWITYATSTYRDSYRWIICDSCVDQQIVYHPVSPKDVESAMMYNCDKRHYSNPQGNFYINPAHMPTVAGNCFILLRKRGNIDEATCTKNHYPMYLITL